MDLNIDGTAIVLNIASTTSYMLGQISPIVYLIAGVFLAFFVAVEILDTIQYNKTMKNAQETREETNRLLGG